MAAGLSFGLLASTEPATGGVLPCRWVQSESIGRRLQKEAAKVTRPPLQFDGLYPNDVYCAVSAAAGSRSCTRGELRDTAASSRDACDASPPVPRPDSLDSRHPCFAWCAATTVCALAGMLPSGSRLAEVIVAWARTPLRMHCTTVCP